MRREHASGVTRVNIFTHNGAPQALVGCLAVMATQLSCQERPAAVQQEQGAGAIDARSSFSILVFRSAAMKIA